MKTNEKDYQSLVVEFILLILLEYILAHVAQVNGFALFSLMFVLLGCPNYRQSYRGKPSGKNYRRRQFEIGPVATKLYKIRRLARWQRSEWKLHYCPPRTNLELQLNCGEITQNKN